MRDVKKLYKEFCESKGIHFEDIQSVESPDETTLFCSAGMQRFKNDFKSKKSKTIATNQKCLRVEDIDRLGDGIHFASFNMLGLFSFRDWGIEKAINFWLEFMDSLGIKIDEAHIHPDKQEWVNFYKIKVVLDEECKWSDGEIGGYCTEFYFNEVEIGNIVNPMGDCIDVGFGMERLDKIVNDTKSRSREELLIEACQSITEAGYKPSNKKQGYVLRRLLRELRDSKVDMPFLKEERERYSKMFKRYEKLKVKFPNQTKEWWFGTHGIEI